MISNSNYDIQDQVVNSNAKVFSFDVFDTVLTRKTATPEGIFNLTQRRLQNDPKDIPYELHNNFQQLRQNAAVLSQGQKKEGSNIYDIYAALETEFSLIPAQRDYLIQKEIETELDMVEPISEVIKLIASLRDQNKRIIFVSDMYLSVDVIRRLLTKVGAYQDGDPIYVSNESQKEKKTGRLFQHILEKEQCQPEDVLHVGDNEWADITMARKSGINAVHFTKTSSLSRYTDLTLNQKGDQASNDFIYEAIAGSSRLSQLQIEDLADDTHRCASMMGSAVAGPILLGYVIWILKEARKRQLKRLYFISRDGNILFNIAKKVQKLFGYDFDLRYMYASRKSVFLSSLNEIAEVDARWILMKKPILSIKIIAQRVGLDPYWIQENLKIHTGRNYKLDYNFSYKQVDMLVEFLMRPHVSAKILEQTKRHRRSILAYFRQEGLMDNVQYGLVDLGWQGTIQDSVKRLLSDEDPQELRVLTGFYFGVNSSKKRKALSDNIKLGYYFSPQNKQKTSPVIWEAMRVMEIFSSAEHGLTLGYHEKGAGYWAPIFKENNHPWMIQSFRLGVFKFIENVVSLINRESSFAAFEKELGSQAYLNLITHVLEELIYNAKLDEANCLGKHIFYLDPVESYGHPFAPRLGVIKAIGLYFSKNSPDAMYWIWGSYLRSSQFVKVIMFPLFWRMYAKKLYSFLKRKLSFKLKPKPAAVPKNFKRVSIRTKNKHVANGLYQKV